MRSTSAQLFQRVAFFVGVFVPIVDATHATNHTRKCPLGMIWRNTCPAHQAARGAAQIMKNPWLHRLAARCLPDLGQLRVKRGSLELKAALERLATNERRSISNYVEIILEEHVQKASQQAPVIAISESPIR
jgi:hypothetical protein